jgi:hypothetical protein
MTRRHFDDPPDDDYTEEVEVDVDGQTAWERARGY